MLLGGKGVNVFVKRLLNVVVVAVDCVFLPHKARDASSLAQDLQ
jgi:hypothetical protein